MEIKFHRHIILLLLAIISGCATQQVAPKAWANKEVEISLPPPTSEQPLQIQQLLTTTFNNKTHSLVVLLDVQKDQLNLVGLTPVGIRLFTVNYNQKGIQTKLNLPIPNLPKANQVLLDIMLAYWPVSTWSDHLPEHWSLQDTDHKRYLKNDKEETIVEISYQTSNSVRIPKKIVHHQFGYTIDLENMEETTE